MENYNLLSLTYAKRGQGRKTIYSAETDKPVATTNNSNVQGQNLSIETHNGIVSQIDFIINGQEGDSATINGKVVDAFGTISDDVLEQIYEKTIPEIKSTTSPVVKFSTTYKSYKPSDVAKIKGIIYAIHHPVEEPSPTVSDDPGISVEPSPTVSDDPGISGEPSPTVSDDPSTSEEPSATPSGEGTGKSFITAKYNEFYNAETMFEYLSTLTGGQITKDTGITRAQLVKLTQNEVSEAENECFFGALNRIFNNTTHFNTDGNGVLSFTEIDNLFKTLGYNDELGEDPTAFLNKVNQYTEEIQTQYKSLNSQKRLEFIIARTREYLEAAGLTKQLNALNRLSSETDTANPGATAKVGQIVITNLNPNQSSLVITQGAYSSSCTLPTLTINNNDRVWSVKSTSEHPAKSGMAYEVGIWSTDSDSAGSDLGLTLDITLVQDNYPWYAAVDVMVHELTHATASQYASGLDDTSILQDFEYSEIKALHDKGAISNSDWTYYEAHKSADINDIYSSGGNAALDEYMQVATNIMYATNCMWGEFAAYQADADYMDSIAGDVFNNAGGNRFGNRQIDTAVASASEQGAIFNHVWAYYDNSGTGNYNSVTKQNEIEAYPEGALEDIIFTANSRRNWTWA